MARIDPERAAALYAEHQKLAPVADIMGVSIPGLWLCLKRHGVAVVTRTQSMKALHADPEFKARLRAGIQRRFLGCEVPSWVPDDLRDDYIDVARLSGDEAAASHVRRLKREAAL